MAVATSYTFVHEKNAYFKLGSIIFTNRSAST